MWTGDVAKAGTDAKVFVQMYGVSGKKTEECELGNKTDNFEQGQTDKFKVNGIPVEQIRRVFDDNSSIIFFFLLGGWAG